MKTFLRLLKFLRPFWGEVLASLALGIGTLAAGIGLLGTSAYLISAAALHPSIAELQVAIVGVRFFGISRAALRYGERLVSHSVNLRLVSSLRNWFFERLAANDLRYTAAQKAGDVLDRVMHNLEALENFYVRAVSPFLIFAVVTLGTCLFVGRYQPALGWILAGGLLITGVLLPVFSILVTQRPSRGLLQQYSNLSAGVVEALDGLEELAAFGSNALVISRVQAQSRRVAYFQQRLATLAGANNALALLSANLTVLALIWAMIPLVSSGLLTGIALAVVVQVAMACFEAATPLPTAAQQLSLSISAGKALFAVATAPQVQEPAGTADTVAIDTPFAIKLEDISYHAADGEFALQHLSLLLEPGKQIALVGPSGAGKSSVADLLLKFKQPDGGRIDFGDADYAHIPAEVLRSQISLMGQGAYLFNSSLKDNLLLAQPNASTADLINVLEKVGLSNWLAGLPKGVDTWLGNHGAAVSGGEYQRLLLARVLLAGRPFLILDEPFANLDLRIKRELSSLVHTHFPAQGVLWITHEYLSMTEMDEIIYLENGQILERGTHAALLRQNSRYALACRLQSDSFG